MIGIKQDVESLDLTTICRAFPEVCVADDSRVSNVIPRTNFLESVNQIFNGNTKLIVIEGEEGIGRTTFLAQFAKAHSKNCVCSFLNATSRWGYDPGQLRLDFCNQIHWVIHGEEIEQPEAVDDGFLRSSLWRLGKHVRASKEPFYFIVDGLEDVPAGHSYVVDRVLSMLPSWTSPYRFLITGDSEYITGKCPGVPYKTLRISGFTKGETKRFLSRFNLNREAVREIHNSCKGNPGNLAVVYRRLQSGADPRSLVDELHEELSSLFEIEWRKVDYQNQQQLNLLALIALDDSNHTILSLSAMMKADPPDISRLLSGLTFIEADETGEIRYVSSAVRKFAAAKLENHRPFVNEMIISYLLEDPQSYESLTRLPGYFEKLGAHDRILQYLSPQNILELLGRSQSLRTVQQKANYGVNAARKLNRDDDLIKFSIQKASIADLNGVEILRSEVEARLALGQDEAAIALAQSTILKEDRLHLLAIILRWQREQQRPQDAELIEQVRRLIAEVDYSAMGDRVIEIASNLLYSIPKLAIGMVEDAANTGGVEENSLDWAFARLSLAALRANRRYSIHSKEFEKLEQKITDPRALCYSLNASMLYKNWAAERIIDEAARLDSTTDKLYILRKWLTCNREKGDAVLVVEHALDLAIRTTAYAPNALVFREIVTPLPYLNDGSKAESLVSAVDSQAGSLVHIGPTEDYIRLQLIMARTEKTYSRDAAHDRLLYVYTYIDSLQDLSLKVSCLARLYETVQLMDADGQLEDILGFHTTLENDLRQGVQILLNSTADHYLAVRGTINALSKVCLTLASEFASALNTSLRRQRAMRDIIEAHIQLPMDDIDFTVLGRVLGKITDPDFKAHALLRIIERIYLERNECTPRAREFIENITQTRDIRDSGEKCRAICLSVCILDTDGLTGDPIAKLFDQLKETWDSIDADWHKIDVGFKIVTVLARNFRNKALKYLDFVKDVMERTILDSKASFSIYFLTVLLVIRSFCSLLVRCLDTDEDLMNIHGVIDLVPSSGFKAELWSEVALGYFTVGRFDEGKAIVNKHVLPLLNAIPRGDSHHFAQVIITVGPALYCTQSSIASEDWINTLPMPDRDSAYYNICQFILRKHTTRDPYESVANEVYDINYDDVVVLTELLSRMSVDHLIYDVIECIVDSIIGRRKSFSDQQIRGVAQRLLNVIRDKLPDQNNIKHPGFRIVSEVQVLRLGQVAHSNIGDILPSNLDELIKDAYAIDNTADRAYILAIIGASLPSRRKFDAKRAQLFKDAEHLVGQIPSLFDRVEHYEMLAEVVARVDVATCNEYLRVAMNLSLKSNERALGEVRQRIVNFAYRTSPELASSLASLADGDEARKETREKLQRQIRLARFRSCHGGGEMAGNLSTLRRPEIPTAAWLRLGSLNAGRITCVHVKDTRDAMLSASTLPIRKAYPMLAWVIENAARRYSNTDEAVTTLRPIYEAVLLGVQLAGGIAGRVTRYKRESQRQSIGACGHDTLLQPGERKRALQRIKDWLDAEFEDYLKICDCYFGPEDLQIIQLVQAINPDCRVSILTSAHHQRMTRDKMRDEFLRHWRLHVSDQVPPYVEIVVVETAISKMFPIHDRWWLTNGKGLRLGTSINTLAITRTSELVVMTEQETKERERAVDQYLNRDKREHKGERLQYFLFTL